VSRRIGIAAAFLVASAVIAIGVVVALRSSDGSGKAAPAVEAMPPAGDFEDTIDNPFFPLRPGTTFRYEGMKDGEPAADRVEVTRQTKTILGVSAVVVLDLASAGGDPEEKTYDWYAQDKKGNVWYLGEDSFDRIDDKWVRNDGSWEAGVDGAKAGIVMEADPEAGDTYRQEYYADHAEDVARVLQIDESVVVPYGSFEAVLQTRDWSLLEANVVEHKYFARSVGEVRSVMVKGGAEEMALVALTKPRD
jgi:hypothetical protein